MAEFAAHGANQEEKMAAEKAKKTIVIGHKNPDTDSICSAIGYANFKTLQTGGEYVPCRAGELNPETTFVLDYFKVDVPKLIKSVKTQVKDIEIRETPGVSKNISLRKAWNLMQEDGLVTLPAVTDKNILEGCPPGSRTPSLPSPTSSFRQASTRLTPSWSRAPLPPPMPTA